MIAVVPALNEAGTVADVVSALARVGLAAVVVDDGSTDGTGTVASDAGAFVLRHPTNVGVGGALRTGFAFAVRHGYSRVVVVDADLQHDPSSIQALIDEADGSGASLVIGSRFGDDGYRVSRLRRALMRALAWMISRRVGTKLDDVTSGFRVISEPLLTRYATDYPVDYLGDTVGAILQAAAAGVTISQTAVRMGSRAGGEPTSRMHAAGHLVRLLLVIAVEPRRQRS
jgi:glycosyltransferase involved in cell wall biosynthesis